MASPHATDTTSSRFGNKASSPASSKGSDGRNVGRPSRSCLKTASLYSDMASYEGNEASPSGPSPTYYTGLSQPHYTGLSRPDCKDPSQYSYTGSSQSDNKVRSLSSHTDIPAMVPNGLYRPNEVSGHISDEETYEPMNPDSDGLLLTFNRQLKILDGQFDETRNRLLRYFNHVSHRLAAQDPTENQSKEFLPVIDNDIAPVVQLNWSPSSAL